MGIGKRVLWTVVAGLGLMSATANAAHHALRVGVEAGLSARSRGRKQTER